MSINAASPGIAATPKGIIARIAALTMRHRRITVLAWVAALIGVTIVAQSVGTRQATNFSLPGTDSQRARDLLVSEFPAQAGDTDQIVFHTPNGKVDAPAVQARITRMLHQVEGAPHVAGVTSPFSQQGADAISSDGQIAFAT